MRLEKLSLPEQHFTLRQSEEGGKLVVEILVDDHAPKGLIRGDLVVTLDRPGIKDQRVLFNGFVR
jgi:hypothetical protein